MISPRLPVFYANEMDIFDALISSKKKITTEFLLAHAKERGILLSPYRDRDSLIEYISSLPHDYCGFRDITDHLAVLNRQDKMDYCSISESVSPEEIQKAITLLGEEREKSGEVFTTSIVSSSSIRVKVHYTEFDYSKTRLRQRKYKEEFIEMESLGEELKIRKPSNEHMDAIVESLIKQLSQVKDKKLIPFAIDMSGIVLAEQRSRFFTSLVNSLDGFRLIDVTKLKVDSVKYPMHEELDVGTDDDDESKAKSAEIEEAEEKMLGFVRKVALSGGSLLNSEEYQSLSKKGFFIYSIIWESVENVRKGAKYEFEALFGNSQQGKNFRYSVRGAYKPKEGGYTSSKRPISNSDKSRILGVLEYASKKAYEEVSTMSVETSPLIEAVKA